MTTTQIIELVQTQLTPLIGLQIDSAKIQQRGIADKIEDMVCEFIFKLNQENILVEAATSKVSTEDIQIVCDPTLYKIDVKTHDIESKFSMPNIIAIQKLKRFYSNPNNFLIYVFVDYKIENDKATIDKIYVKLLEEIDWSILHIQGLGLGQLQIKDMNKTLTFIQPNRILWMNELKKRVLDFCDKQTQKFEKLKNSWR